LGPGAPALPPLRKWKEVEREEESEAEREVDIKRCIFLLTEKVASFFFK
jgi:hypothetical protein